MIFSHRWTTIFFIVDDGSLFGGIYCMSELTEQVSVHSSSNRCNVQELRVLAKVLSLRDIMFFTIDYYAK